ncbi:uncharacterized protein LOC105188680 [Harpegnathos saltator]|uniref:uncharacterized protein LOC105188680 n=1 Tax=Harpegnathos saltator TaxID=610380 RepID=UPI000DBED759|nr:uncharacterized protein LOC105188680 [Harpegnathos saltator]
MISSDHNNIEQCVLSSLASTSSCTEEQMTISNCSDTKIRQDIINSGSSVCVTIPSIPTTNPIPDNEFSGRKNKKMKSTRTRALYDLRKKQLDCEERRVNAINELKEAINEHNSIQRERNEILRNLIESNKKS